MNLHNSGYVFVLTLSLGIPGFAVADEDTRARGLGIPFEGQAGPLCAGRRWDTLS